MTAQTDKHKWNRAKATLTSDMQLNIKFEWDQELADELERLSKEDYHDRNPPLLEKVGGKPITKKNRKKEVETRDNLQTQDNKILLPKEKIIHATRSPHKGRHTDKVSKRMEREMDDALNLGKKNNWTQEQYEKALKKIKQEERAELKSGQRALNNKNKRDGAE